jgi:hypothetical protein
VHAVAEHIACDTNTNSELVVVVARPGEVRVAPLIRDGNLIGVLNLDSPLPSRFGDDVQQGLEAIAEVFLGALTLELGPGLAMDGVGASLRPFAVAKVTNDRTTSYLFVINDIQPGKVTLRRGRFPELGMRVDQLNERFNSIISTLSSGSSNIDHTDRDLLARAPSPTVRPP